MKRRLLATVDRNGNDERSSAAEEPPVKRQAAGGGVPNAAFGAGLVVSGNDDFHAWARKMFEGNADRTPEVIRLLGDKTAPCISGIIGSYLLPYLTTVEYGGEEAELDVSGIKAAFGKVYEDVMAFRGIGEHIQDLSRCLVPQADGAWMMNKATLMWFFDTRMSGLCHVGESTKKTTSSNWEQVAVCYIISASPKLDELWGSPGARNVMLAVLTVIANTIRTHPTPNPLWTLFVRWTKTALQQEEERLARSKSFVPFYSKNQNGIGTKWYSRMLMLMAYTIVMLEVDESALRGDCYKHPSDIASNLLAQTMADFDFEEIRAGIDKTPILTEVSSYMERAVKWSKGIHCMKQYGTMPTQGAIRPGSEFAMMTVE